MEERVTNPTEQRLLRAFMQFKRAGWHQRSIEGCTPSEIRVLFCIKRGGKPDAQEMKVSEISKHLHVTAPTITQLLKALEAQELIERRVDQADRRAVGIQLTQKGERVTQKAEEAFFATFHGLIEYLGEEQSNQLAELLSQVSRYFEEKAAGVQHSPWNGNEDV
jgi:DNA-binding MarR family transcriptional regulator